MEGSRETEDVEIFVKTFSNLSQRGRKLAIHKLVSTLDSDEMDMVIEAIDSKIDNVALQQSEDRQSNIENESLEDSGVSSISPSETNFDQVKVKKNPIPILIVSILGGRRKRHGYCHVLSKCRNRGERTDSFATNTNVPMSIQFLRI